MHPPALPESYFLPAVGLAVRDFVAWKPSWAGRIAWWVEGSEDGKFATVDVKMAHEGGSSAMRWVFSYHGCDRQECIESVTSYLVEYGDRNPPPVDQCAGPRKDRFPPELIEATTP